MSRLAGCQWTALRLRLVSPRGCGSESAPRKLREQSRASHLCRCVFLTRGGVRNIWNPLDVRQGAVMAAGPCCPAREPDHLVTD